MEYVTRNFEPQNVLEQFENICSIPHCSNHEHDLAEYITTVAKKLNLEINKDKSGNILIRKPAQFANNSIPSILLQGHMDMVCVKNEDCKIDMKREPVRLILHNNILRAQGTSLGADNAVGLCNMLAVMMSSDIEHPPLELLFTVEEEIGLKGIRKFDMSCIKSKRMITMDCGDPDVMVIGGAGSIKADISKQCKLESVCGTPFKICFKGLKGGHSGIEIGKGRANAIELIGRLLISLIEKIPINLISISTEGTGNSIPKAAECIIVIDSNNTEVAINIMDRFYTDICTKYAKIEENLKFNYSAVEISEKMMISINDSRDIADFILLVPSDVQNRAIDKLDWVMCSSLLTNVECRNGCFNGKYSIRANLDELKDNVYLKLHRICELLRFNIEINDDVPAWPIKYDSNLQELCKKTYVELFDDELKVEPIHGCVEAGIISYSVPYMDIVGIAPMSRGAHTTDEHLFLETMNPFWEFLTNLLKKMCQES